MKNNKIAKVLLLFPLLLITFVACEKSGGGDDGGGIYLPDFSNEWDVLKGNTKGAFFILVDNNAIDSAKGTGNFSGNNNINSLDITPPPQDTLYQFAGSFQNTKVTLRFLSSTEAGQDNGPQAGLTFKGIFDSTYAPHRIRLINTTNTSDSLVLKKAF